MIEAALDLHLRPADEPLIAERRTEWAGPYRAMSAYKGDERIGARDWPWIVVGAAGINMFGRLWPRDYALAIAVQLNAEAAQ